MLVNKPIQILYRSHDESSLEARPIVMRVLEWGCGCVATAPVCLVFTATETGPRS